PHTLNKLMLDESMVLSFGHTHFPHRMQHSFPTRRSSDLDPPLANLVESTGPRSKNAISFGCAGSVQSKTEMPPWYHACTITSRPGTGMSDPLCATQFSFAVCGASIL